AAPAATARRSGPTLGLSRVGCTRLVSSTTTSARDGSTQREVPVKPVWPKLQLDRRGPALLPSDGVSQPTARELPGTTSWRVAKARAASSSRFAAGAQAAAPPGPP